MLDFSWSPTTPYPGFTIHGNDYPPEDQYPTGLDGTPIGVEITFTASVNLRRNDIHVIRYEWSLGDGVRAFGNPIKHTYGAVIEGSARDATRVSLCVVDSLRRRTCIGKQILLT